jgi:hypothetical protein
MYSMSIMSTMVSQFKCILCPWRVPWYHSLNVFCQSWVPLYHSLDVFSILNCDTMVPMIEREYIQTVIPWYSWLSENTFKLWYHGTHDWKRIHLNCDTMVLMIDREYITMVSQFKCILCQSWVPWYHNLNVFSFNHEYHGITV